MNSKEIEYRAYTLGDIKVIELLLMFRYKYDENMMSDESALDMTADAGQLNEEMIITYADLDKCIERCSFSNEQLQIIEMLSEGYSYVEIAKRVGIHHSTVSRRLKTIYGEIKKENECHWRKGVYNHKLGLRNKKCSKCGHEMPATTEFYSNDDRNKDGFQSQCRRCKV